MPHEESNGKTKDDYKPVATNDAETKMTFDTILESIGTFGPRQRLIFCLISLAEFFGALHMLLPVFVGAEPNWYCATEAHENGNTSDYNHTTSGNHTLLWKQCEVDGQQCSNIVFKDDFSSIVSEWSLVCDNAYVSDLMTSIQMAGLMLGAASMGQVSDLIGRKKSFYLAFLFSTIGGLASGFTNSWQLYAACRFVVGAGFGGNQVVQVIYPMEFLGKKWRVLSGTVGLWAIGCLGLTLTAYFIRDWRILTIVTAASCFLYFLCWWWIPESPRWLIQHGHMDEAERIINTIAKKNNRPTPDVALIKRIVEEESKDTRKFTYLDLFREWRYAKTALIKFLAWFTVFVLYYAGSYNVKNFSGDRYFNMFLSSLIDWAAMLSVIPTLTFMGRRKGNWMYLGVGLVMLLSILAIILAGKESSFDQVILAFALIAKSSGLAGTYSAQIYSAELFPTAIRNIGVGCGSIAARLGGIVAPQMVYLGTINQAAPYIVTSALCAIVIPMLLLLPETKGRNLQDTYESSSGPETPPRGEEMKTLSV